MKIELNRKYSLNGETVTTIGHDGVNVVVKFSNGNFCSVHPQELIEIPEAREPREWDAWVSPNEKVIGSPHDGWKKVRVREVLPTANPSPAPSEFPEVGVKDPLKYTGHVPCPACGKVQWMHAKCQCGYARYPRIESVVTEPPIPEGFPPVPETPGFRKVNRGFDWTNKKAPNGYLFADTKSEVWLDRKGTQETQSSSAPYIFYIELLPAEPTGVVSPKSAQAAFMGALADEKAAQVKAYDEASKGVFATEDPIDTREKLEAEISNMEDGQPEWRELGPHEVIERGDEVSRFGEWIVPGRSVGKSVESNRSEMGSFRARRRVTPEPQAEQPHFVPYAIQAEPATSYPPPESEWPEKPDPGPGMVWERMPTDGKRPKGSIALILPAYGTLHWRTTDSEMSYYNTIVFRAVPAPQDHAHECTENCKIECDQKQDPVESAAKAALEEGWLWFGNGPLADGQPIFNSKDVIVWKEGYTEWDHTGWHGTLTSKRIFYAIRAGTDLAAKNGLGEGGNDPLKAIRAEFGRMKAESGDYSAGYRDGLIYAIKALTGKGGER